MQPTTNSLRRLSSHRKYRSSSSCRKLAKLTTIYDRALSKSFWQIVFRRRFWRLVPIQSSSRIKIWAQEAGDLKCSSATTKWARKFCNIWTSMGSERPSHQWTPRKSRLIFSASGREIWISHLIRSFPAEITKIRQDSEKIWTRRLSLNNLTVAILQLSSKVVIEKVPQAKNNHPT